MHNEIGGSLMSEQGIDIQTGICIRDAARFCGVPAYTLRFWEREFARFLSPQRTGGRQRRYTDSDLKNILQIKRLLWDDKFSIEGARRLMSGQTLLSSVTPRQPEDHATIHDLALHIARAISERYLTASPAA